ncbi:hypothetical protein BST97_10760 [Nonlabens spongiae]|uniref:GIY-YIG domain-containing protein n=1 Tax=Nonlabens spongiae TaxID=331648 RepID=A0A1W6MLF1_9FLAO|nr:GIY-YIG nuclease family protein [Nonlabens spongiae]ARN78428.1 hypothetical protein BST97_10760 [Nonlabens spongiae]
MAWTYILESEKLNKYYIGACHKKLNDRVLAHNSGKYGSQRFTSQTSDWKLILRLECEDYAHSIRLERKIKSMKSRKYIQNLLKYEDMRQRVIKQTRDI